MVFLLLGCALDSAARGKEELPAGHTPSPYMDDTSPCEESAGDGTGSKSKLMTVAEDECWTSSVPSNLQEADTF